MRKAMKALLVLSGVTAYLADARDADAYLATFADVTDFITQWGGWFLSADVAGDPSNHYWMQTTYSAKTTNNITVITLTRNAMQKENKFSGQVCSQDIITTVTITFDPRYLDTKTAVVPVKSAIGKAAIWTVTLSVQPNLVAGGNLAVVRELKTIQAPTCPKLGQRWDTATEQTDTTSFAVEFGDQNQAAYFVTLIKSYQNSLKDQITPGQGSVAAPAPTKSSGQ